jgi:hypothetical protein
MANAVLTQCYSSIGDIPNRLLASPGKDGRGLSSFRRLLLDQENLGRPDGLRQNGELPDTYVLLRAHYPIRDSGRRL